MRKGSLTDWLAGSRKIRGMMAIGRLRFFVSGSGNARTRLAGRGSCPLSSPVNLASLLPRLTFCNAWLRGAPMTNARTVLVVEDNPLQRRGVAAVLGQEGYDAVVAANGKEALERLSSKPTPDVMLLDMMMSEADGWQQRRLLRQYHALSALPAIIVTAL